MPLPTAILFIENSMAKKYIKNIRLFVILLLHLEPYSFTSYRYGKA